MPCLLVVFIKENYVMEYVIMPCNGSKVIHGLVTYLVELSGTQLGHYDPVWDRPVPLLV